VFRKQAAVWLQDQYRISGRRACRMVCLSSSMYYYRHQPREDTNLRLRIRDIALSRVRYGFWRIFVLLRREGFTDNHKRVYRLYKEEGLNLRSERPRRSRSAAHRLQRLDTPAINRVWSMDFVQDALFNGSRFRILAVVDNYSKKCLSLLVGKSLKGEDVQQELSNIALCEGTVPERIQCDNGSEFISKEVDRWAYENKVTLDFSRPGKPTDNPYVESFNGKFRDECLSVNWFLSMDDAKEKIEDWRWEYNHFRPHSTLDDLSPQEFIKLHENTPRSSNSKCST
jgi:putative transposase